MKFLCLAYEEERKLNELSESDWHALRKETLDYVDALRKSGRLIATQALQSATTASMVRIRNGQLTVTDGPFAETKELVAGFWLWQVKSKEEAIEWAKRCPNPTGVEGELEIRQVFEAEDFGAEFTPELREREERLRAEISSRQ
jgi:hypothetical protein